MPLPGVSHRSWPVIYRGLLRFSFGHLFAMIANSGSAGNYFERPPVFLAMDDPEIFLDTQVAHLVQVGLLCFVGFGVPAGEVCVGCLPFFSALLKKEDYHV